MAVPGAVASWERGLPASADGVLRETEIEQLDTAGRDHHIRRLQIPMDDALPVCRLECVGDFNAEGKDLAQRQRAALQTCSQGLALEEFEHQILALVFAADVVQPADVWVGERGDCLRLAFEPRAECGVGRELGRENLDRDRAIKASVACSVDLAHAAGAEHAFNFIRAEPRTRGQCHWRLGLYSRVGVPSYR